MTNALSLMEFTVRELCSANMLIRLGLEELSGEAHLSLIDRAGRKCPTMADDFLKDEPIFLLTIGQSCALRVGLEHKHQTQSASRKISGVSLTPDDGNELDLLITESKLAAEGHEVVMLFQPELHNSTKLSTLTKGFGMPDDKYVKLNVKIRVCVASAGGVSEVIEFKKTLYCCLAKTLPLSFKRFERFILDTWKYSPQWIRDGARGAVILAEGLVKTETVNPDVSSLIMAGRLLWNVFKNCFILPCFRLD